MFKIKLTEETRFGMFFLLGLLVLLFSMLLLNYFIGGGQKEPFVEKEKEKTVIVKQAKQDAAIEKLPSQAVVKSVRDAIKQGNYSTAYLEVNHVTKNSPAYDEARKLADEMLSRKAPGVRKDTGISSSSQIRYFDESTPRNRTTDALYIYFVDISGTLWPRFCIQNAAKRPLGITGFIITADAKKMRIDAPSVKFENIEKGVAEWYDVPLDRLTYDAAQAIIKAKKVTLNIVGNRGKVTRDVTDPEIKGIRNILDGYAALGGNLDYLKASTPAQPKQHAR